MTGDIPWPLLDILRVLNELQRKKLTMVEVQTLYHLRLTFFLYENVFYFPIKEIDED